MMLNRAATAPTILSTWLRRAVLPDGVASGALGMALALAADPLAAWFDLPSALLRGAGLALIPFGAVLALLASRPRIARAAVLAVVAVNVAWVAGSLVLLVARWVEPTAFGRAFVGGQAVAVAVFAGLQGIGLRRARSAEPVGR